MDEVEAVVIGAGVIGLAAARALALAGHEVVVLERAYTIGFETSSRNSEVIHGGLYYPQGSLKATACVAGRERLYAYCAEHGVPHARLGKLIVATEEAEIPGVEKIEAASLANGVTNLEWLTASEAQRLEPELNCVAALLSPSTGIIDSHALMLAYQGEAEEAGAFVAFRSPVLGGRGPGGRVRARCRRRRARDDPLPYPGQCRRPACARPWRALIDGVPPETIPPAYFCRGVYFTLLGKTPFRRLIYPVPVPGGLGVHITLDLAGQARFGPDVEWIPDVDYAVDPRRGDAFYAAVRRYWPGLRDGALAAGLCRHPPEDQRPERGGGRFCRAGAGDARRPRSRQSLRHRIAGPDGLVAAGRRGIAPARPVAVRLVAVVAQPPERHRPRQHFRQGGAEDRDLAAPIEILRQPRIAGMREQRRADSEV